MSGTRRPQHRSPRPPRPRLDRDRVLRAALQLVDHEVLDALTIRRLAAELGVEAMAICRHAASKDDLLDGLIDITMVVASDHAEHELHDGLAASDHAEHELHDGLRAAHRHLPTTLRQPTLRLASQVPIHHWSHRSVRGTRPAPAASPSQQPAHPAWLTPSGLGLLADRDLVPPPAGARSWPR